MGSVVGGGGCVSGGGGGVVGGGVVGGGVVGTVAVDNRPAADWPTFWAERRLRPLVRRLRDGGGLDTDGARVLERLCDRLPERDDLTGPPEPPARLHGDLWSGNVHVAAGGRPALIDPAAYYGHREAEFGMMTLFGGFSPRVFAAYDEAYPLEHGWRERNGLYQLYHLLNHLNLFGSGYHASVMAQASRY